MTVTVTVPSLAMRGCHFLGIISESRPRRGSVGPSPAWGHSCPSRAVPSPHSRRPQHPSLRATLPGQQRAVRGHPRHKPLGLLARAPLMSPGHGEPPPHSCGAARAPEHGEEQREALFGAQALFCFTAAAPLSAFPRQRAGTSRDLLQGSPHPDFPALLPCPLPKVPGSPGEPLSFPLEAGRAGGCPAGPSPNTDGIVGHPWVPSVPAVGDSQSCGRS